MHFKLFCEFENYTVMQFLQFMHNKWGAKYKI